MGFSTSSIIDFLDLDGKMAALNEQETAVKDHVLKLLSGPPDSIRLRMSMRTKSGKSFAIETQSHAQQLAESMKRAEKVSFIVLKST